MKNAGAVTKRQTVSSGARWESLVGYSWAGRVGQWVSVAGTTAAAEGGGAVGGDDIGNQAREALRRGRPSMIARRVKRHPLSPGRDGERRPQKRSIGVSARPGPRPRGRSQLRFNATCRTVRHGVVRRIFLDPLEKSPERASLGSRQGSPQLTLDVVDVHAHSQGLSLHRHHDHLQRHDGYAARCPSGNAPQPDASTLGAAWLCPDQSERVRVAGADPTGGDSGFVPRRHLAHVRRMWHQPRSLRRGDNSVAGGLGRGKRHRAPVTASGSGAGRSRLPRAGPGRRCGTAIPGRGGGR